MAAEEFYKAAFSSKTGKWDTPADLIRDLKKVFRFDLDVCADRPNVCGKYYTEQDDGLSMSWAGLCWMNPPYGREIGAWMSKAAAEAYRNKATVVCLVPARTDTRWWQDNIDAASFVTFIKGRLKFGDAKNSAPFPSAFVVFGHLTRTQKTKLNSYGWSIEQ